MTKAILASNEEIRLETSRYLQTLKNLGLNDSDLPEIQMCLEQYTGCAYQLERKSEKSEEKSTDILQEIIEVFEPGNPEAHYLPKPGSKKIVNNGTIQDIYILNRSRSGINHSHMENGKPVSRKHLPFNSVNEAIRTFNAL